MTTNAEIAARLEEMADLLGANDVEFKPRAYRRAADTVRAYPGSVADLATEDPEALDDLEGVGEAISAKIVQYVETGEIEELEELRAELPVDMAALTRVEGVGPKTVGALYEALGITTLDELAAAAEAGDIREVSGFGAKTEENILAGIEFARTANERHRLGDVRPLADEVLAHLRGVEGVESAEVAGSIRRWQETIGDVDVLVAAAAGEAAVEAFTAWDGADEVIEAGTTKAGVRAEGVRVDLRVVDPTEFGAALQYFTGDKGHNLHLRNIAIRRGLKMNEYGVFDVADVEADDDQRAGERIAGETEESMYAALELPWMAPELRRDTGEIEAAAEGALPELVEEGAIRGDLHTHTDWSDGDETIAGMVAGAADFGYEYHCVSDHGEGPGVVPAMGLSAAELREQAEAVAAVREEADIAVFHGVEANVDAEGGVHPDDDVLYELDLVVASPHVALDQDVEAATDRLVSAIEHPAVRILGHPSGRLLGQRPGMDIDPTAIAEAAVEHDVALEINANPARLDLWGDAVQAAVDAGATLAINTDAHSTAEFELVRYGVHTARRGWAEEADVLNARDADGIREFIG